MEAGWKRRLRVTTDGHEHVADSAGRELQGRAEVLDLDDRLDRDAGLLGARCDLQARRIVGRVAGVGEDEWPAGELGRRHGTAHAVRMRARVEHLVAQRRPHEQAVGVHGEHDEAGLEPALPARRRRRRRS